MKKEIISVIILVILTSFSSGCIDTSENDDGTTENDIGEDFVFTALDGSEKHLSDYRGKVVILDTWATWCVPCRVVMPELKKIYENYSRDDLEIFSVNIDSSESESLIQSFKEWFATEPPNGYGIDLNWIFGNDIDGSISENYLKGGAIPTLVIFNRNGQLHYKEAGVHGFTEVPYGYDKDTPLLAQILNELIE